MCIHNVVVLVCLLGQSSCDDCQLCLSSPFLCLRLFTITVKSEFRGFSNSISQFQCEYYIHKVLSCVRKLSFRLSLRFFSPVVCRLHLSRPTVGFPSDVAPSSIDSQKDTKWKDDLLVNILGPVPSHRTGRVWNLNWTLRWSSDIFPWRYPFIVWDPRCGRDSGFVDVILR